MIGADSDHESTDRRPDAFTGDIVLIHGLFSSARTWDRLLRHAQTDPTLQHANFRTFEYESPRFRPLLSPSRIPDYNDIEGSLRSFLRLEDEATPPLAIVTHSQGGLIIQRFLASMAERGRARDLARIRFVMLLACPNEGSQYLSLPRRLLGYGRHPQARDLRPLNDDVHRSRQIVLSSIINARSVTDHSCPVPIWAYAGRTDNIVPAASAKGVFSDPQVIPGDHSSILDPEYAGSRTVSELASLARRYAHAPHAPEHPPTPTARHDINSLPPDITDFSGRVGETTRLVHLLRDGPVGDRGPLVNVFGKPGVGKSALSIHAARMVANDYADGQLHVDLRGQNGESQGSDELVARLLTELGDSGLGDRDSLPPERRLQEIAKGRRILLVLDNAIDAAQIRVATRAASSFGIVATSRVPLAGLEGVHSFPIDAVSPEDGLRLLQAVSHRTDDASEAMTEIVDLCGGLPLALRIAGAQLKSRPQTPPGSLADRLRGERERIARLQIGDLDVASSFSLSLTELSTADVTTLRRMALANATTYDAGLVGRLMGCTVSDADDRLDRLVTAQLVDQDGPSRFSLHDLVRLFAAGLPATTDDADEEYAILMAVSATFVSSYLSAIGSGARSGEGRGGVSSETYLSPPIAWGEFEEETGGVHDSPVEPFGSGNAVILGDPGTGKTSSAIRHLHHLAAVRADGDTAARVPFYLPLREWRGGSLVKALAATTRARFGVEMPADVVRDLLSSGQAHVLADGLDEILDVKLRTTAAAALEDLASDHPDSQITVFSRPVGYEMRPLNPAIFATGTFQPWSDAQIRRYFALATAWAGGSPEDSEALWQSATSGSATVGRSPRVLTLMAHNYVTTGRVAYSAAEATESHIDQALNRETETWAGLTSDAGMTLLRDVLGRLAVDSWRHEVLDAALIRASAITVAEGAAVPDPADLGRCFLLWARERSAILTEVARGRFQFDSPLTRDLLAGRYLVISASNVQETAANLADITLRDEGSLVVEFAVRHSQDPRALGAAVLATLPRDGSPGNDPQPLLATLVRTGAVSQDDADAWLRSRESHG